MSKWQPTTARGGADEVGVLHEVADEGEGDPLDQRAVHGAVEGLAELLALRPWGREVMSTPPCLFCADNH